MLIVSAEAFLTGLVYQPIQEAIVGMIKASRQMAIHHMQATPLGNGKYRVTYVHKNGSKTEKIMTKEEHTNATIAFFEDPFNGFLLSLDSSWD